MQCERESDKRWEREHLQGLSNNAICKRLYIEEKGEICTMPTFFSERARAGKRKQDPQYM